MLKKKKMKEKIIDLQKSVYQLCKEDENLAPLLAEIGFTEIVRPIMLNTVGKVMTLIKGSALRSIDLNLIITKLQENGYTVINSFEEENNG